MPGYEYKCPKCNIVHTLYRSITEKETQYVCETCNVQLRRVYSKVGVTFNGSGFYSTDK